MLRIGACKAASRKLWHEYGGEGLRDGISSETCRLETRERDLVPASTRAMTLELNLGRAPKNL
jgi:hypothetical protein